MLEMAATRCSVVVVETSSEASLGKDEIYGQRGNDGLKGSSGADKVFGGGDDIVRGGTHAQVDDGARYFLDCGEGDMDTVYYIPDKDVIRHCEDLNPFQ